jgi:hypothetical protein
VLVGLWACYFAATMALVALSFAAARAEGAVKKETEPGAKRDCVAAR